MTGRRPAHTMVFDNNANFRSCGQDSNGAGEKWTTCPGHFKQNNWTTLGGGKTFHPNHPPNWDGDHSWDTDMPYFDFDYYKKNPAYPKGACPGPGGPQNSSATGAQPSHIDTWCALDEPDENFYDYGLANNTIERLRYAAPLYKQHGKPFFIQSGFARPHAPWHVPLRMWQLYEDADIKLAKHQLPPENMPGIAWKQDGFYNSSNGFVFMPQITEPMDAWASREMRHACRSTCAARCVCCSITPTGTDVCVDVLPALCPPARPHPQKCRLRRGFVDGRAAWSCARRARCAQPHGLDDHPAPWRSRVSD